MSTQTDAPAEPRLPLTRERVLRAAVDLADRGGIEAVSMRKVGQELGVEAMSLYNHVANKEEILEGMVDTVMEEIETALGGFDVPAGDWRLALRNRILTARESMLRHPWTPGVLETRTTMSPRLMRYADSLLGILREGGFSFDLAHHAMHVLGSRMLGFAQELFEPDDPEAANAATEAMMMQMADQLPYMMGMIAEVAHEQTDPSIGFCDYQVEFAFSLDLILDGLERARDGKLPTPPPPTSRA